MGKIGHKNPPVESRWEKGQSGNPSGRPKKEISFKQGIADTLGNQMSVRDANGRTKFKEPLEVALINLCKRALTGSESTFFRYFKVIETLQSQADEQERVANERDPVVEKELKELGFKIQDGRIVRDEESPVRQRSNDQEPL